LFSQDLIYPIYKWQYIESYSDVVHSTHSSYYSVHRKFIIDLTFVRMFVYFSLIVWNANRKQLFDFSLMKASTCLKLIKDLKHSSKLSFTVFAVYNAGSDTVKIAMKFYYNPRSK